MDDTIAGGRATPRLHRGAARGRLGLRSLWVEAVESAPAIATPGQLLDWLDIHVRSILRYSMVAAATGSLAPRSIRADRLVVRGLPLRHLEGLRDGSGSIALPCGAAPANCGLQTISAADLAPLAASHLKTVVVLTRGASQRAGASYFLFAGLPAPPDARQHYLMSLLAPHMHYALERVLDTMAADESTATTTTRLTRRETELLTWLVAGSTTAEIASASFRSAHTVSNQIRAILRKLRAANRTEAIALALGLGLVAPQGRAPHTRLVAAQLRADYLRNALPVPAAGSKNSQCYGR